MTTTTMNHFFHHPVKILQRLKESGFTQKQAETQVDILSELVENDLTSKSDLIASEQRLRLEIEKSRLELEHKISELELRLTVRVAAIVISTAGFFYTLEKLF